MLAPSRTLRRLFAVAAVGCCIAPAAAHASAEDVWNDCADDEKLTRTYTQKEYRDALAKLPSYLDEYSGCRDVIRRAQVNASGKRDDEQAGAGQSGGQPPTTTPDEAAQAQREVSAARRSGASDQRIADVEVQPGALAYRDVASVSKLPGPLLVLAALLLGAAIAIGAYLLFGLVRTRHVGP